MAEKWGATEREQWRSEQTIKRSYADEVLQKIPPLKNHWSVEQYASLSYDPARYPLFLIKNNQWNPSKPLVLVTGGVHGYETSGVQGALAFVQSRAADYTEHFDFLIAPCISPWGYETINRWNPLAIDPNRSFFENSPAEESAAIMQAVKDMGRGVYAHFDLHETTDTDNSVFRPALAARDAIEQDNWDIPDGFYTVGDSENPQDEFQTAVIDSVRQVTHIAPADPHGKIIGSPITQEGVINYPIKKLGLCAGLSNAKYCTTTEMYPDSPKMTDQICIDAQVTAIVGGLDYLINEQ